MRSIEDARTINLQDSYTLIYYYIVQGLMDTYGLQGEAAAREGTRRFGRDRALTSRKKHLEMGAKINMVNLFSLTPDLPPDPRFRREAQRLNPQERVSHTLVCPMADVWKAYGGQHIGRIYCEEFHFACYNTYAYQYTQVNLAKTLTQEGDEYCAFNVVLRPEKLPDELKPLCFEEYDPQYQGITGERPPFNGRRGFEILWIKLYYYLLEAAVEQLGEAASTVIASALTQAARDAWDRMEKTASEYGLSIDNQFIQDHYPLNMAPYEQALWEGYRNHNAQELVENHFHQYIEECLGASL